MDFGTEMSGNLSDGGYYNAELGASGKVNPVQETMKMVVFIELNINYDNKNHTLYAEFELDLHKVS
jgi:hypothetical protein